MTQEQRTIRERTCIGCGKLAGKTQLFRICRQSDGSVLFDPTGRAAGRGAYVCSEACFEDALGKNKLSRALRTSIGTDEAQIIASELKVALEGANAR